MKTLITLLIIFSLTIANGQSVDYTPDPYNLNNPGVEYTFTPHIYNANSCGLITWVVTNGMIWDDVNYKWVISSLTLLNTSQVKIKWDDVAAIGKLKAVVTCKEGTLPVEKSFPICSLNGLTLQNPQMNVNWKNLDLCATTSSITLFVDVLMMTWTGGVNGSPQERADGYE